MTKTERYILKEYGHGLLFARGKERLYMRKGYEVYDDGGDTFATWVKSLAEAKEAAAECKQDGGSPVIAYCYEIMASDKWSTIEFVSGEPIK